VVHVEHQHDSTIVVDLVADPVLATASAPPADERGPQWRAHPLGLSGQRTSDELGASSGDRFG
jgi:hypothetical protein